MKMEKIESETKPFTLGSLLNQHDTTSLNLTQQKHICRICLDNNSTLQSIFETDLDKIIMKCASVFKDDQLPSQICENCITLLNKAYKFKQLAEDSECILKQQYLGKDTTEKSNAECFKFELAEFEKRNVKDEELTVEHLENSYEEIMDDYSNWYTEIEIVKNEIKEEFIDTDQYKNVIVIEENSCGNNELNHTNSWKKHVCSICDKICVTTTDLEVHMRSHTNKKSYTCEIPNCSKHCSTKTNLYTHIQSHSANICSIYGRKWKKPTYFNIATSSHSDKNSYKCKISKCNRIFKTKRELNKHVLVHKGQKLKPNNHICPSCDMAYPKASALQAHMKVHVSTVSYKGEFPNCNKRFKSSTERREHSLYHKGGSVIHEEI